MPSATESASVVLRDVRGTDEIKALEDLQIRVWGDDERDIVPLNQLVAASHVGGSLIGAFDGDRLVGFVYGFYGHIGRRIVHHSHMLGVDPDYRSHDLGFRLKAAQREKVLAGGFTDRITWTFDPLQSLNAHFNFAKLGVISDTYKVNVYGERGVSFLHQNGTDRLFVTWLLDSPRVRSYLSGERQHSRPAADMSHNALLLVHNSESNIPVRKAEINDSADSRFASIEIPSNINSIERADFDLARRWREETRHAFSQAFSQGYTAVDYSLVNERTGSYLLEKVPLDSSVEQN